jgi:hypothetical protein
MLYSLATARMGTTAMHRIATGLANRPFTVRALPSGQTHLVALLAALMMPKLVVTWPTKNRARRIVVVVGALHSNP